MKLIYIFQAVRWCGSPSVWREWIEILGSHCRFLRIPSPSVWREWIEINIGFPQCSHKRSPSVWREWIEMALTLALVTP